MWCRNCNIETNDTICPVCSETTVEDIPIEIYWCVHCKTPIIQNVTQADKGICPLCGEKIKYLSADLRPVFPEERLLLELLLDKEPNEFIKKSVWAANSRYYIDGKSIAISSKTFQLADTDSLINKIGHYKKNNSYKYFEMSISKFVEANKSRLNCLKTEAFEFVRKMAAKFDEEKIVISFSGGKDSTVTADVVIKAMSNPNLVHIFGNTTLEFPSTVKYAERYRQNHPQGDGSEEHQVIQLLKELSPIDFQSYYEAYEERFGVRKESAQGNPTISGVLANYYTEGIYAIDVPSIDERDVVAFKEVLAIKNFWFTDELEREFKRVCVNSSTDAFNSAAFKRIGYSLNMGYAYNDMYSSVISYFDAEVFSSDIVDLNELDKRLVNLPAFNSALYKNKMDLEYIEVAPKILMSISKVESVYGITLSDVKELQDWVLDCEEKYYNAHSLWNDICELGCSAKLQNNEWMCTCIFRQQDAIASLQVAGGIIL